MNPFIIEGINWKEFKQEKLALIRARHNPHVSEEDQEWFEGLLNLMDHIQDQAYAARPSLHDEIYLSEDELLIDNLNHPDGI